MQSASYEINQLACLIDSIARRCFRGIPALLGQCDEPSREQIKRALFFKPQSTLKEKIRKSVDTEPVEIKQEDEYQSDFEPFFLAIGGFSGLVQAVREFRKADSRSWGIYYALIQSSVIRPAWGSAGGTVQAIADRFGMSVPNVYHVAKSVPQSIACLASMAVVE